MTDIPIVPARLKAIRKGRKIGRSNLAKHAGLTERQLMKLETATRQTVGVSHAQAVGLAEVLQVPLPTLTGEFDVSAADLKPLAHGSPTGSHSGSSCSCCP